MKTDGKTRSPNSAIFGIAKYSLTATLYPNIPEDIKFCKRIPHSLSMLESE